MYVAGLESLDALEQAVQRRLSEAKAQNSESNSDWKTWEACLFMIGSSVFSLDDVNSAPEKLSPFLTQVRQLGFSP